MRRSSLSPKIKQSPPQIQLNSSLGNFSLNLMRGFRNIFIKVHDHPNHSKPAARKRFLKGVTLVLVWVAAITLPIRHVPGETGFQTVHAQSAVSLKSMQVQLWPEYDQPTMLVIIDFELPKETELPAKVSFRFPDEANLTAVASQETTGMINAEYDGPNVENGWQVITVLVKNPTRYHLEYYEPLKMDGNQRSFVYQWNGTYPVTDFSISILKPMDTTSLITEPRLDPVTNSDGSTVYTRQPASLARGEQFSLRLTYNKSTDTLFVPPQDLRPSLPVDEKTEGRISLQNYLPFILAAIGLMVVLGGIVYYWQSGSKRGVGRRRRKSSQPPVKEPETSIYCPQCGTRAQLNDLFCRVCGARLRKKED